MQSEQRDKALANRQEASFRKLTVMLPPEFYERLIRESTRRKIAGESNGEVSSMMRDAIICYFKRK